MRNLRYDKTRLNHSVRIRDISGENSSHCCHLSPTHTKIPIYAPPCPRIHDGAKRCSQIPSENTANIVTGDSESCPRERNNWIVLKRIPRWPRSQLPFKMNLQGVFQLFHRNCALRKPLQRENGKICSFFHSKFDFSSGRNTQHFLRQNFEVLLCDLTKLSLSFRWERHLTLSHTHSQFSLLFVGQLEHWNVFQRYEYKKKCLIFQGNQLIVSVPVDKIPPENLSWPIWPEKMKTNCVVILLILGSFLVAGQKVDPREAKCLSEYPWKRNSLWSLVIS